MRNNYLRLVCLLLAASFFACVPAGFLSEARGPGKPLLVNAGLITEDTVWRGLIQVEGLVEVAAGAVLSIEPGSRINFDWVDADKDGIGDSGLLIKGQLLAYGTKDNPIIFTSTAKNRPRAWGEVRIEHAAGPNGLRYCRFKYAYWGLHIHFSATTVEHCRFENSEGGLRFRTDPIVIRHSLIQNNKIGIRYLKSNPAIEHNTIRGNLTGIFVREGSKQPVIAYNNIYDNKDYNLKLGEAQQADISSPHNFWGSTDEAVIQAKIFDYHDSDYIGKVQYRPFALKPWEMSGERQ